MFGTGSESGARGCWNNTVCTCWTRRSHLPLASRNRRDFRTNATHRFTIKCDTSRPRHPEPANRILVIRHTRSIMIALSALQLYEWLLLLGREVEFIHKARISFINVCYFFCRYYTAAAWVGITWSYVGDYPKEVCARIVKPAHAVLAPCQFTSHGVMLMRAYAFTSRSRQVLIFLGLCYLILIGINFWVFCTPLSIPQELYALIGPTGCYPDNADGAVMRRVRWSILASAIMDIICLSIVIIQCYRTRARDVSLGRYIEKQGICAFVLVYAINLTSIILSFQLADGTGLPMALVLPNLVACRLVLQLRERCQPPSAIELEARNSRIVQDAFDRLQDNRDFSTIL